MTGYNHHNIWLVDNLCINNIDIDVWQVTAITTSVVVDNLYINNIDIDVWQVTTITTSD
jgi:hypothetical protein